MGQRTTELSSQKTFRTSTPNPDRGGQRLGLAQSSEGWFHAAPESLQEILPSLPTMRSATGSILTNQPSTLGKFTQQVLCYTSHQDFKPAISHSLGLMRKEDKWTDHSITSVSCFWKGKYGVGVEGVHTRTTTSPHRLLTSVGLYRSNTSVLLTSINAKDLLASRSPERRHNAALPTFRKGKYPWLRIVGFGASWKPSSATL